MHFNPSRHGVKRIVEFCFACCSAAAFNCLSFSYEHADYWTAAFSKCSQTASNYIIRRHFHYHIYTFILQLVRHLCGNEVNINCFPINNWLIPPFPNFPVFTRRRRESRLFNSFYNASHLFPSPELQSTINIGSHMFHNLSRFPRYTYLPPSKIMFNSVCQWKTLNVSGSLVLFSRPFDLRHGQCSIRGILLIYAEMIDGGSFYLH